MTVEVIRRRLVAIADEVDVNITRTAFSPYIYEYKDYAVGIVDANGDLICQCTAGMPVFVADVMRTAVRDGLELYGPDGLHDGDIIITNYAGTIGQHLNNVTMYTPIHAPQQPILIGFMVVVMHWIDVGGRDVGSTSKFATDIFQEGIQFRTVKLRARGEPVLEMYRMIEHNTRFPVEMMGDINSQIGGCLMGRDGVVELVGRYGIGTFHAALAAIWNQSEAASRAAIRAIPDGTYSAKTVLDNDGLNPGSLPCKVTVIVKGDEMTIDLSEVAREVRAPMNSGRSGGGEIGLAAGVPLSAGAGRRRQRRHVPAAQARAAGRHHRQRQADGRDGLLQFRAADLDRSRDPRPRSGHPGSGGGGSLRHLRDLGLCRAPSRHGRALAMPRQRLRRLGSADRSGRPWTVPHDVPRRHAADSDRGARGQLPVHDRKLRPAHRLRADRASFAGGWA